jgi:type II secretion system protein G
MNGVLGTLVQNGRRRLSRAANRERGFTLLELLVVIAIIAILIALLIPAVFAIQNRAKVSAAKTEAYSLQSAMDEYKLQYGDYPCGTNDSNIGSITCPITTYNNLAQALSGFINLPQSPNPPDPNFTFISYTFNNATDTYTLVIKAKDSSTTQFTASPTGVTSP